MVDVSKIKAGDTVKLEAIVVYVDHDDPQLPLRVRWNDGESEWIKGRRVAEHVPAPRKFEIGDTVLSKNTSFWEARTATVMGADGYLVWVRWPDGSHGEWNTASLIRANEPKP
jgi:hypothetical protein